MGNLIKVSAQSRTSSVAGAIAGMMREDGEAEMQAIGASAVNRHGSGSGTRLLKDDGIDIGVAPVMNEVQIDGSERTAVRLSISADSFEPFKSKLMKRSNGAVERSFS